MKVLFQGRGNAFQEWGGDTTQMLETKKSLERLGVQVDVSLDTSPRLEGYDIVHVFNIQTVAHSLKQVRNAKKRGRPTALSTIYWERRHMLGSRDYLMYHSSPAVRSLARISRHLAGLAVCLHRSKVHGPMLGMVRMADILLPNSIAEMEILVDLFDMPALRAKSAVIPNGVTLDQPTSESESTRDLLASLPGEFLLQVASFDPGKGQLNLIRAMMERPDIPLVFIGRGSNAAYHTACRSLAEKHGNICFVDGVPHDQICWFYRRARVHALPSLRESPGLATLEAAVNGANCVVSIHGPVAEYFGQDAWFCDPLDLDSIRAAVLGAWDAPRNTRLRDRIVASFTWDEAARATLRAYERILHQPPA